MVKMFFSKKNLIELILPASYLVAVLSVDYVTKIGTISPFFLVVGMLFMSVTLQTGVMIFWVVIYTGVVCAIFLDARLFTLFSGHPYYDQYTIPVLRAGTYMVVGWIFVYLSIVLNRLKRKEGELNSILKSLPWPIITSDHNGKILYWNESAQVLLPELKQEKLVSTYFDLLAPPNRHGYTIARYINRLEQNEHLEPLQLNLNGRRRMVGHTRSIRYGNMDVLLTILAEPDILRAFPQ